MFRYLAFIWNTTNRTQCEAVQLLERRLKLISSEWRSAIEQKGGLKVFYASASPRSGDVLPLHDQTGVVLGTLFERRVDGEDPPRRAILGPKETERILATGGRQLIETYWGRYVLFLYDVATDKKWVLRDPTGALPCLRTTFRGVEIYLSCMEDAARLEPLRFTINWQHVAVRMIASMIESQETALNEVSNVLGGECIEIQQEKVSRSFYWHPCRIARSNLIEEPAEAATALRQTVKACVHAWASCHNGILHRLSGGLDSSIVLGCLQHAPTRPKLTCLNYYSKGSDSDEREFARLAAQRAACTLIEQERNPNLKLEGMLQMARSAEPSFYPHHLELAELEARLAQEVGASAIFDGNGGDGLFYQSPVMPAAADYIHHHGFRPALLGIALDVARVEVTSVWSVLRSALRDRLFKRRWDPLAEAYAQRRTVRPEVVETVKREKRFLHPWFNEGDDIPHGKLWHIYYLSIPLNFSDPMGRPEAPEHVQPLLSQPIFELCLRVPSYVLTVDGWDRAIARLAFVQDVPREILRRRTKGGVEEHVKEILMRNIGFVRALLLDGMLVREGLLDRHKLEEALSSRPTRVASGMVEIFSHLSAEVWLRSWVDARHFAVA